LLLMMMITDDNLMSNFLMQSMLFELNNSMA